MGFLQGQEVILPVVAADPDIEAVGLEGQDILGRFFFELVPVVAADEVHLFHFGLDIGDLIFRTRVFQGVFQRIEIVQVFLVLLQPLVEALSTRDWYKDLPFTKKPTVQHIQPSSVIGISDPTNKVNDHTFITAMGLLRVGYDTIEGSDETQTVKSKLTKLLRI